MVSKDVDIVAITETHLDDSIDSLELFPNTYTIFRKDRNRRGGGVLIAVKNNICCLPRHDLNNVDSNCSTEMLWLEIRCKGNKCIIFGVFYRPPNSTFDPLIIIYEKLSLLSHTSSEIVLTRDVNIYRS